MSISIIGAGNVGKALGQAFLQRGMTVVFGVPDPDKYRHALSSLLGEVRVASTLDAIVASDVIVLAVPHAAVGTIARSFPDWQGKILVDATNPLAPGLTGLSVGTTTSGAEELAKIAVGARVIKAFNTTGAENLADSRYPNALPFMPVCGDDAEARQHIMALATLIGFDAVDMGPLTSARYLEPLAMAWIQMAIVQGHGRNFALARVRRPS
jgi:hypothetical protein